MTNADLAAYLNGELKLSGRAAVTENVIRQWVLWDVLPRAKARGNGHARGLTWNRNERDLRRGRQLAAWRAAGVRRETALIVHAYLAWGYRDWKRVREALATELEIATAAIRKGITTNFTFSSFAGLSQTKKRALRTQLGPLDKSLHDSPFALSPELYALAGQAAFEPDQTSSSLEDLLSEHLSRHYPDWKDLTLEVSRLTLAAQVGLFACEDESDEAAMTAVTQCSERAIREARSVVYKFNKSMKADKARALLLPSERQVFDWLHDHSQMLQVGPWLITIFVFVLRGVQISGSVQERAGVNLDL